MRVILKQDVEKLGRVGDIVEVAPGYARNFLIPKGLAIEVTKKNIKIIEEEKRRLKKKKDKEINEAKELAEKLSKKSVTIPVQVGEDDKLFGAVTSQDIAEALAQEGIKIDKRKILLKEPLKALGIYNVEIKIHPEVNASIRVWVVKA